MPNSFRLREARPEDEEQMRLVELDAARAYAAVEGHEFCVDLPARDSSQHALVRERGVALIGEIAGLVSGFAMILPIDGRAHFLEIAVAFKQQGRGLGTRLIGYGEAWARYHGYREITLTTFQRVPWNLPFYERLGYAEFAPEVERLEFQALLADEIAAGFTLQPRVAMRKCL